MKKHLALVLAGIFICSSTTFAVDGDTEVISRCESESKVCNENNMGIGCSRKHKKHKDKAYLEKKAAEKGITVDELKEEMKIKREAKLKEKADERGITVEALKEEMKAKKEAKLKEKADEQGITVEELKEKKRNSKGQ